MIIGATSGIGREIFKQLEDDYECFASVQNYHKFLDNNSNSMPIRKYKKVLEIDFDKQKELNIKQFQEYVNTQLDLLPEDIEILINNAGIVTFSEFTQNSLEDFEKQIQINLIPSFIITQYFVEKMQTQKSGVIINISSIATKTSFANSAVYSATKSAVAAMMNSIREENRLNNIKITNIFLGATNTSVWNEEMQKNYGDKMIKPDSVGKLVKFIVDLSQISDFMLEELIVRPQMGDL